MIVNGRVILVSSHFNKFVWNWGERTEHAGENKFATQPRGNGNRPISQFLLTADQMFTPNLNDKIAQFNLVTRHLATVSRHLRAGARW